MKVLFEKKGAVAYVTINRPERLNACDFETYEMLAQSWREFRDDPALRVGILTGAGERAFCAGSDVKTNYVEKPAEEPQNKLFPLLFDLYKPIIAAINGHANGGGLEQALACDIRVAAEHAQFGLGEVRLGWLPGAGGTQRLPRLIPLGRALEMLYTGRRLPGDEALRIGLCDRLSPPDSLRAEAHALAAEIGASAPLAVRSIRQTMRGDLPARIRAATERERAEQERLSATDDFREGVRATAERRPPKFTGR